MFDEFEPYVVCEPGADALEVHGCTDVHTSNNFDERKSVCMHIHIGIHVTRSNCTYLSPNKGNRPAFLARCLMTQSRLPSFTNPVILVPAWLAEVASLGGHGCGTRRGWKATSTLHAAATAIACSVAGPPCS
jgi:hypothetical protein